MVRQITSIYALTSLALNRYNLSDQRHLKNAFSLQPELTKSLSTSAALTLRSLTGSHCQRLHSTLQSRLQRLFTVGEELKKYSEVYSKAYSNPNATQMLMNYLFLYFYIAIPLTTGLSQFSCFAIPLRNDTHSRLMSRESRLWRSLNKLLVDRTQLQTLLANAVSRRHSTSRSAPNRPPIAPPVEH